MALRMHPLTFDQAYREQVVLADGTVVLIRCIRPDDKELLRRGFEQLSPESKYLRFLSARTELSDDDLRRLTELDDATELALGAVIERHGNASQGLGIARFAREENEPEVAEAAVAVIDAYQGRGLGRLLLHRLVEAALARGVRRFRCEILAHNDRILHMLREHVPDARFETIGGRIRAEIELPDLVTAGETERDERQTVLDRILGQSARGAIEIRLRKLLLKGPD